MRQSALPKLAACLIAGLGAIAHAQTVGDDFATPRDLGSATEASFVQSMNPLTLEAGEPSEFVRTLWCLWQAPSDGICEVRTARTVPVQYPVGGADMLAEVYQGDAIDSLTPVPVIATGVVRQPRRFRVTAGQVYRILVGMSHGYFSNIIVTGSNSPQSSSPVGAIVIGNPSDLNLEIGGNNECAFALEILQPPAHDDFANSHDLGTMDGVSVTSTNRAATPEPGEPPFGNYDAQDTVWHHYSAPSSGRYEVLLESAFRLQLDIYSGATMESLTLLQVGNVDYNGQDPGVLRIRRQNGSGRPDALSHSRKRLRPAR